MRICTGVLGVLIGLCCPLATALGGELSFTRTMELENASSDHAQDSLSVPSFPVELGELKQVRVDVDFRLRTSYGVENTHKGSQYVETHLAELFELSAGSQALFSKHLNTQQAAHLESFDGNLDYLGRSATRHEQALASDSSKLLPGSSFWLSQPGRDRVEIVADYLRETQVPPGLALSTQDFGGRVELELRVTYLYEEGQ